jgi:hypothetical protein
MKVKLSNKKTIEMSKDSVIASLANQFINTTSPETFGEQYVKIFSIFSKDIEHWLNSLEDDEPFELFGDWIEKFSEFKSTASFSVMKEVCITFSDGSVYGLPLIDALYLLTAYGKELSYEDFIVGLDENSIQEDDVILSRITEELNWDVLSEFATETKRPDVAPNYSEEFKQAKKHIEVWKIDYDPEDDEDEDED